MSKRPNPELIDDENPEWSDADTKAAKTLSALPASLRRKIGGRGPQKAPTKERVTIRLSPDVVDTFRATGDGWQTRINEALRDWLKTHSPA